MTKKVMKLFFKCNWTLKKYSEYLWEVFGILPMSLNTVSQQKPLVNYV